MELHLATSIYGTFNNARQYKPAEARSRQGVLPSEISEQTESLSLASPIAPSKIFMNPMAAGHVLRKTNDGSWDRSQVARYIDLVSKASGETLDAETMLKIYDLDGNGSLSLDEQTAMISALEDQGITDDVSKNALDRMSDDRVKSLAVIEGRLRRAASFYESLFWFEEPPLENPLFGA
ncbi:MAG: hypothetical protein LBC41_08485 [Clostridiales bacterium]|jgi:hypothetical protein|nr:hypothetical protein [Clostridiales bacterium]